jgi:O-antigen ligase
LLGWRVARLKGALSACLVAAAVSVAFWAVSPSLRERVHNSLDELTEYSATNKATSIGQHLAFLTGSLTIIYFFRAAHRPRHRFNRQRIPPGHLWRHWAAGVITVNPHNQTFAVAIQIGLLGAIVLWSMWIAHFRLFRGDGSIAWFGTVVVVENVVSSTVHSHLFDFAHGWLYVFGVGVLGGMALHKRAEPLTAEMGANIRHPDTRSNPVQ